VRRTRRRVIYAALASGIEAAAAALAVGMNDLAWLGIAAALHAVAVRLSLRAAVRRRPELTRVERDVVLWTAIFVPLFGPPFAWLMPRPAAEEEAENAHAVFEQYSEHVKPDVPDYERTVFTGDYERDLARELDAESYHEVLRHGTTDQKRNALRRLADLGQPRHLELVRRCLLDPDHEVRLYAYSEIERLSRGYEEEIAKRSKELSRTPGEPEALLTLARTYFRYAESGIHDEEMAAFYYGSARRFAEQAQAASAGPEAVWIEARALGRLGDFAGAESRLAALTQAQQGLVESCVARADLAFRRRDFAAARAEAVRIREFGAEPPEWLRALEAPAAEEAQA
jgi:hypothetical protein